MDALLDQKYATVINVPVSEYGSVFATVIESSPECPSGWFYHEGNCYQIFEKARRFQAMRKCNQEAAFLTSVENQEEQDFLMRAFA